MVRARLIILLLCIFPVGHAAAEEQYWGIVGSFQNIDSAQGARADASELMTDSLAVIGTETDRGFFYRVAIGPFMTQSLAQDRIERARNRGFSDAWLWRDDGDGTNYESSLFSTGAYDDWIEEDFEDLSLDIDRGSQAREDDADMIQRRKTPPPVVDEAPPGYKLNKLRRDAALYMPYGRSFGAREPPPPRLMYAAAARGSPSGSPNPAHFSPPPTSTQPKPASDPLQILTPVTLNTLVPFELATHRESEIAIEIDGELNEPMWGELAGVDQFLVVDPDTGDKPTHSTLVKMFYTERGLYVSFTLEQPSDTLVQVYSGRDARRINRDTVGITLDTSGDGRYGYWVNLALGGNQIDGTVLPERRFSSDWDGAWQGATQVTASGWNAEIFLPWSQFAMPKQAGRRVINAYASRKVAYMDERYSLPALPFTQPLFMSALQPLALERVDPRQQWNFYPYSALTQDEVEGESQIKVGADLFWRPSTNVQLTGSLYPDFGNVESDDVIVNLGAFETFYPEKRLFFQEGIEVFNATPRASGDDPVAVLNTRRIGGTPRPPEVPEGVVVPARELNQPTELLGAVKAVGQFGKVRYGILTALEDDIKFDVGEINYHQDGNSYGIARLLYEDKTPQGDYRAVGTISSLAAHPEADAVVHGVDFHYLTASGAWKLDGQIIQSDVEDEGKGYGGFVDVGYTVRQGLVLRGGISHFDDRFDINDVGFSRRNDATNMTFNIDYSRSDLLWLRQLSINSFTQYEVNGEGYKTRKGFGSRLGLDLLNQDRVRLRAAYFPARADDRSSRGNGTFKVKGRHDLSLEYVTDTARRLSVRVGLGHGGEEEGGDRMKGNIGFNWRPIDQINIGAFVQYQDRNGWLLWQEGTNFTTFDSNEWRPRINLDFFITAKQQIRLAAQWVGIRAQEQAFYQVQKNYDNLEKVRKPNVEPDDFGLSRLNLQLRYRWEIAPLSELSVVYTLNGAKDVAFETGNFSDLLADAYAEPVGEQLIVKLRYRLGS